MVHEIDSATDVVELKAVAVFRCGVYPQGEFDQRFIEAVAENYDPTFHEAPNILVHSDEASGETSKDEMASPLAFGWVKRLFVKGQTLFADFASVPRRFAELVLAGRVKKRSVELYADLSGRGPYLRAVAWPLVPEVKSLADVGPRQVFEESGVFQSVAFEEKEATMADVKAESANVSSPSPKFITMGEAELLVRRVAEELMTQQRERLAELEVAMFCEQMVACGRMSPADRRTEQPLLIEQRKRELVMTFAEGQSRLSEERMEQLRRRVPIVVMDRGEIGGQVKNAGCKENAADRAIEAYFAEHQAFFTRMGVTVEDLKEAEERSEEGK